jgi:hypothetical protein
MAAATGYTSQYGFQLYDTTGTTEDWNYAANSTYGYTIEIGPPDGAFHMPYDVGFIKEWNGYGKGRGKGLREALLVGAESSFSQRDHSVISGKAPAGRTLRIKKEFVTETSEWCERGFSPIVSFVNPPLSTVTESRCFGPKKPAIKIPDGIDQTTVVPANGRFSWHVNPSGRPFVKAAESYRFTCEDGGSVVFSTEVLVNRGETKDLGAICGASPDPVGGPPAVSPTPVATPPAGRKPAKKAKKKLTARQRRILRACLAKANRTAKRRKWSSKRRASARRACERKAAKAAPRKKAASRKKAKKRKR